MTDDPTEAARRAMIENNVPAIEAALASAFEEETWDTAALKRDFEVLSFLAPYVVVRRRVDGAKGTLMFDHSPRVYFDWREG